MLDRNAIVSTTIRLDPPLEGAPEEQLRSAAGLSVELEGERRVRLDPDAADLERRLRESQGAGGLVILTEDEAHHVIDVRAFTPPSDWPMPPFPPLFPEPTFPPRYPWPLSRIFWLLQRLWYLVCWPWWWWCRCLTPAKAQQVFTTMAGTTCNPLTVPPPCIPFLYPDDGCWARADEMCRLMINMGYSPRKVWIDHSSGVWLQVSTKNNPNCYVEWGWHVAPTLCAVSYTHLRAHET